MLGEKTKEQLSEEIKNLQKEIAECKKNRQLLKNLIQATPVGVGLVRDRILQWVNTELADMLGYSLEEFKDQSARILYPSDQEYNRVGAIIYGQGNNDGKGALETQLVHKNGNVLEVLLTATYLNKDNPKEGAIFAVIDITEQKKLETQLKISIDDWDRTFDAIPDVVSIHDINNTILRVNKAFAYAFDLEVEEVIGKKCYELIHKRKMPIGACPFELTKNDFKVHSREVDDSNIGTPLLVTSSPIFDEGGKLVGAVHVAKDISEMRKAKEEVDQRIKTLQRFHSVSVGRELRMKELKEKIRFLEEKLSKDKRQG